MLGLVVSHGYALGLAALLFYTGTARLHLGSPSTSCSWHTEPHPRPSAGAGQKSLPQIKFKTLLGDPQAGPFGCPPASQAALCLQTGDLPRQPHRHVPPDTGHPAAGFSKVIRMPHSSGPWEQPASRPVGTRSQDTQGGSKRLVPAPNGPAPTSQWHPDSCMAHPLPLLGHCLAWGL